MPRRDKRVFCLGSSRLIWLKGLRFAPHLRYLMFSAGRQKEHLATCRSDGIRTVDHRVSQTKHTSSVGPYSWRAPLASPDVLEIEWCIQYQNISHVVLLLEYFSNRNLKLIIFRYEVRRCDHKARTMFYVVNDGLWTPRLGSLQSFLDIDISMSIWCVLRQVQERGSSRSKYWVFGISIANHKRWRAPPK